MTKKRLNINDSISLWLDDEGLKDLQEKINILLYGEQTGISSNALQDELMEHKKEKKDAEKSIWERPPRRVTMCSSMSTEHLPIHTYLEYPGSLDMKVPDQPVWDQHTRSFVTERKRTPKKEDPIFKFKSRKRSLIKKKW